MTSALSRAIDQENLKINLNLEDHADEPMDLSDFFDLWDSSIRPSSRSKKQPKPRRSEPMTERQFQAQAARHSKIMSGYAEDGDQIIILDEIVTADGRTIAESFFEDGEIKYRKL